MQLKTLLLLLISYTSIGQPINPHEVYSLHTRLGMNGNIKSVTAYKYTRLKYTEGQDTLTTGTLYSVIKNEYDTVGLIVRDSTVIFYTQKTAYGYCKTYSYDKLDSTNMIHILTRYDCIPYHDNTRPEETTVILSPPNDYTVIAKEYPTNQRDGKPIATYRFSLSSGQIKRIYFEAYVKRRKEYCTTSYKYDQYGNFTETTILLGDTPKQVIHHKISTIDAYGNALRMLNFINDEKEPDFMTVYKFEYYE